jgi:hypothetical protein
MEAKYFALLRDGAAHAQGSGALPHAATKSLARFGAVERAVHLPHEAAGRATDGGRVPAEDDNTPDEATRLLIFYVADPGTPLLDPVH